jgi:hypothetical protein
MRSTSNGCRRFLMVGLLAPLLPCVAGCWDSMGTVSGQVTYKSKPVPGGLITFRPSQPGRNIAVARLDEEGRFEVTVPAGEVEIAVDNRELQATGKGLSFALPPDAKIPKGEKKESAAPSPSAAERLPGRYVPIPDRYYRSDTSDLKMTVKSGMQTQDFELKGSSDTASPPAP